MNSIFSDEQLSLLLRLLLAHVLSDYFLQKNEWSKDKNKTNGKGAGLYWHVAVTFITALVLSFNIWASVIIAITHYLIDYTKANNTKYNRFLVFFLDQGAHFLVIIAVWLYAIWPNFTFTLEPKTSLQLAGYALSYIVVSFPVGVFIGIFTYRWRKEVEDEESLQEAGTWIGILERVLILTFIYADLLSAIGFLITAKAILRFKDSEKKQAEYVLIGTLLSFAITITIGLTIHYITK